MADIRSKPASAEYRENFDRIFGDDSGGTLVLESPEALLRDATYATVHPDCPLRECDATSVCDSAAKCHHVAPASERSAPFVP